MQVTLNHMNEHAALVCFECLQTNDALLAMAFEPTDYHNHCYYYYYIITFCVRHGRGEMYIGHDCLSVCLSLAAFPHYCTDPDVTWGNGRGVLSLCTIGQMCNRCTCFIALTT